MIDDEEELKKLAARKLIDDLVEPKDLSSESLSSEKLSSSSPLSNRKSEDSSQSLYDFRKSISPEAEKTNDSPLSRMASQSKVGDSSTFTRSSTPKAQQSTTQQAPPEKKDPVADAGRVLGTLAVKEGIKQVLPSSSAGASAAGASAAAPTAVGSTTLANGLPGLMMSDGSTVAASSIPNGMAIGAVLPWVGLAGMAWAGWENFKSDGGEKVLQGGADRQQNIDALMNQNIATAWINPVGKIAGVGTTGSVVSDLTGQSRHKDVYARDWVRGGLQKYGFLDEKNNLTLADGTKYSVGFDQNHTFTGADGKTQIKNSHELDTTNMLAPSTVGMINPIAEIISAGDDKLRSDYAGMFSNAAMSNSGQSPVATRDNSLKIYKDLGYDTPEKVYVALDNLKAQGRITDGELAAYKNGVANLFSGKLPDGSVGVQQAQASMDAGRAPTVAGARPQTPLPLPPGSLGANPPPNFQVKPPPQMSPNYQGIANAPLLTPPPVGSKLPGTISPEILQQQSQNWVPGNTNR